MAQKEHFPGTSKGLIIFCEFNFFLSANKLVFCVVEVSFAY